MGSSTQDQGLGRRPVEEQGLVLLLQMSRIPGAAGTQHGALRGFGQVRTSAEGASFAFWGLLSGEPTKGSQTMNTGDSSGCWLHIARSDKVPETAGCSLVGGCWVSTASSPQQDTSPGACGIIWSPLGLS